MFANWNDRDQVGGTLWPDLTVSEDHIVPHPMKTEETTLFASGDYGNDKREEGGTTNMMSSEKSTQAENNHLGYKSDSGSCFHSNEELSSSQTEIDSWLDIPNLCIDLKDDYTNGNSHNSVMELMNDLTDAADLNSVRGDPMQLDHEAVLLGHEDRETEDFLDTDWATFGTFDDIENLFRKYEPIFGQDILVDPDGFLSPSKTFIDSTAQSIPMPDLPLCKDQISDKGCSSLQLDVHSGKQSSLQKEKEDGQKMIPRSQNKAEERSQNKAEERWKNRPSRSLKDTHDQSEISSSNYHSLATNHMQMQFGDANLMEQQGFSNQIAFAQHGYLTYSFPGLSPYVQIDGSQKRSIGASHEVGPNYARNKKTSNKSGDAKLVTMTPQEKMKKLRRIQKMQAQLAIEQQHLQYSHQNDAMTSTFTVDEGARKVLSSELSMLTEEDESKRTSTLTCDPPSEETVYYQLQDVVEKLDTRIRLCIRDSLLRLARSANERQSVSDRSSTNKCNKDEDEASADEASRDHDRSTSLAGLETDTNPIDRIVANLLFQRPTEAHPRLGSYELLSPT